MDCHSFWANMDWELFWTAFGAIGTSIGSIVTAIAVVVAVKQYKEPLNKRLKISFNSAMPIGLDVQLYCISVANAGVRTINISNIHFNVGKKDLILNFAQFSMPGILAPLSFPAELQPEQKIQMYIERSKIAQYFAENLSNGHFRGNAPVKIAVIDQTGGRHLHRTNCTVRELASL